MSERDIEHYARRLIREAGGIMLKFVSPGVNGVPDDIVLWPGGRIDFIEFKAPGGRLAPVQRKWILLLEDFGFSVELFSSKEEVDAYLDSAPISEDSAAVPEGDPEG